jgi:uroporphyrinogen decarboxylase
MISKINEADKLGFQGMSVAAFESRMAKEMEDLITRHGGRPQVAPSMCEIPLSENKEVFDFYDRLKDEQFDVVILMTGVGTRALFQALEEKFPPSHIERAFKKITLVARGPKPVKVLADHRLKPKWTAPEPNTWREVVSILDEHKAIKGKRIAVQEYGVSNPELPRALEDGGASEVTSIHVYRWALPENLKPLNQLIESIIRGQVQVALFTSSNQVHNVFYVAKGLGKEEELKEALSRMVIGSVGPVATETLQSYGLAVDVMPEHPKMGFLVKEIAGHSKGLYAKKSAGIIKVTTPAVTTSKPLSLEESLFLKACWSQPTSHTPIWIMRQAGRYLPEYREIRSTVSFLTLCKRPDLAAKVTVAAQEVLDVDAAILFADILLISEPMGFDLEFVESGGPVIHNPFRGSADLKRLKEVNGAGDLSYVMDAVKIIRRDLKPHIPLIGFAGAPFTLASYLIEGGASKDFYHTRSLLAQDNGLWDDLMKRIVAATISYLNAQVAAGAQALQLFDSWVGILSPEEFRRFALPYVKLLISGLKPGVPIIYFGTETEPFYPWLKDTGATVIGVDWRMDLDKAWKELGNVAIQGNLNPEVLLTDPETVKREAGKILSQANGRPGHIFNLGHGILPQTPMENVRALIQTVKEWKN